MSGALVFGRLREAMKFPTSPVLAGILFLIALFTWIGGSMVNRITREYEERFSDTQKELRERILSRVAPGAFLKGRLVNRYEGDASVRKSEPVGEEGSQYESIPKTIYTVEFKDLVRSVPVYLSFAYVGSPENIPEVQSLDRFFPPRFTLSMEDLKAKTYAADVRGEIYLNFRVDGEYRVAPLLE